MATTEQPTATPTHAEERYIRNNATKLSDLPPPENEWERRDVPERFQNHLVRLKREGVIEKVSVAPDVCTSDAFVWRVTPSAWHLIQQYADRDDCLPCGHVGFTNLADADAFECNTCAERYTRNQLPF